MVFGTVLSCIFLQEVVGYDGRVINTTLGLSLLIFTSFISHLGVFPFWVVCLFTASKTWPRNLFAGISPGNFEMIFNCCPARNSSTLLAVGLHMVTPRMIKHEKHKIGTATFCQLPVYQWLSITKGTLILRVDESWFEIPLTDPMKYNSTTNYHDNNDEQNY